MSRGAHCLQGIGNPAGTRGIPPAFPQRLRDPEREFSGLDPEGPVGRGLRNVDLVIKSWPDIRNKLQKAAGGNGKFMKEALKEMQKVFVRGAEVNRKQNSTLIRILLARYGKLPRLKKWLGGKGAPKTVSGWVQVWEGRTFQDRMKTEEKVTPLTTSEKPGGQEFLLSGSRWELLLQSSTVLSVSLCRRSSNRRTEGTAP